MPCSKDSGRQDASRQELPPAPRRHRNFGPTKGQRTRDLKLLPILGPAGWIFSSGFAQGGPCATDRSNAAKHAFPVRNGHIKVRLARRDANTLSISVCDNGIGLPPEFDFSKSKRLGMRVVTTLARQLGGNIAQHADADGTEFTLLVPLEHHGES
jgi:Histidine kinase-, DNA gyrase B-, and HSP90-like ATPase